MKNTIWFFSFETLGRINKNILSFFNFFVFLVVLTKTKYCHIGFCIFSNIKILPDINQNDINCKILKKYFVNVFFFFIPKVGWTRPKSVGWARLGPKLKGLVPVHKLNNQPLPHFLQKVNYSRSACKWGQGRSKKEINRAARGYLGVV